MGSARRMGIAWSLGVFAGVILLHAPLLGPYIQNGDGAVYNQQVERRDLSVRTTHIGYVALGVAFDALWPGSTDTAMNVLCAVAGAVGATALWWIALSLGAGRALALLAALLALASHAYVRGMVLSEVDTVLASLTVTALALHLHRRTVLAGPVYGLAMLVSPLAAWSLPWFVLLRTSDAATAPARHLDHLKRVVVFGLTSLAVYAPVVGIHWDNYFHGGRGILTAPREPLEPLVGLERSLDFFTGEGAALLPLMLAGLLLVGTRRGEARRISLALGVSVSVVATALLGERFVDVPVQLPNWLVLCAFAAVLGPTVGASRRWLAVPAVAILLTALPARLSVAEEVETIAEERATYLAMKEASAPHPVYLVGLRKSWDDGVPFERIVYGETKLGRGLSWGHFRRVTKRIARDDTDFEIWFQRRVRERDLRPLLGRYDLEERSLRGRDYQVLVPAERD
ncbi:MAG: hypothetical protein ACQEXJ_07275 [Myxococcota bacterium]